MLWNSVVTFLSQIIVKPRRSSGGRLHRIWSLWFSPSRFNWEDRQSCLQGSLFLSFCFSLLMSAIQNIVLEYIFIWTVGRNYFKLISHSLRSYHNMSPPDLWKWKWSNGVGKSEMSIIWCISITNNVKSNKKFNETAQTANFTDFPLILCGNGPKTMQTQTLKRLVKITSFRK